MPAYTKLIVDLFQPTQGGVTVSDSNGETFTSDDLIEVGAWASKAFEPTIDLVTTDGDAVGIYVAGNPDVVEPQPSIDVDGGMIYMIDGNPLPGQATGFHLCPLSVFLDKKTDAGTLKGLTWYTADQLDIVTPGSASEITLMLGRSRQEGQGKWKPISSTFGQFTDTLRAHKVGDKDGACYLQGESADGARKSSAQIANYILGVDLDSGAPLANVMRTIQKHGLEAVIYTTHSHLKDTSEIKRDHFLKKMGASDASDIELLKAYLIEWKGVLPEIVANLEVLDDAKHTAAGVVILVRHNPMPKFRAVFPLSEAFVFAKRGGSQADAINEWKERYAGFCTDMGFFFDEKCVDPARLFYLPRHKAGDTSFGSWPIAGDTLDLDKFSRVRIARRKKTTTGPANAFTAAAGGVGADDDDDAGRYITVSGFDLRRWSAKFGKRFEIETMLDTVVGGDFMREPRQSGKMGVHVECPFEAEHSSFGGGGTFVVNAGDNIAEGYEGGFTFNCQHNACHGRDRLDFLKELLEQEAITEADLTNEDYLLQLEDDQPPSANDPATPEPSDGVRQPPSDAEEEAILRDLNSKYAVVLGKNAVSILLEPEHEGAEYQLLRRQDFELLECNRKIFRFSEKGPPKAVFMTQEWLAWEQRRLFKRMGFYPGMTPPADTYNTFSGWPTPAVRGSWSVLKHHLLNNVCEGVEDRYDYLTSWIADLVQNPSDKAGVATIVTGAKGCGKSKVFDWLRVMLGRYAVKIAQADGITGKFNAHHENKILVVADEAVRSIDSRTDAIIKDLITSTVMQIEQKGRDQKEVNNFIRLAMLSNDPHVVRATLDERRYFVLKCGEGNIQDQKFFSEMDREMKNGGLEAMMYDLLNHQPKNGWASLRRPPMTPYLRNQQVLTLNAFDRFFIDLVRNEAYESEGGERVDMHESMGRTHTCHTLRIAMKEYVNAQPYGERMAVDYDAICAAAKRMIGATDGMGERAGNRGRLVTLPPLREARRFLEENHGITVSPPIEIEADDNENVVSFYRKAS